MNKIQTSMVCPEDFKLGVKILKKLLSEKPKIELKIVFSLYNGLIYSKDWIKVATYFSKRRWAYMKNNKKSSFDYTLISRIYKN
jgi:hypothetical protein